MESFQISKVGNEKNEIMKLLILKCLYIHIYI